MNTASRPLKRKKCFYVVIFYWVCVAWIIYAYNVYANISHVHYTSQSIYRALNQDHNTDKVSM